MSVSEKPILFNSDMVRAILAGCKTQTRRIIKPQPCRGDYNILTWGPKKKGCVAYGTTAKGGLDIERYCPLGQVGGQLWVRETFAEWDDGLVYRASNPECDTITKWTPSIHMPRKASRIQLEIVNIRIERLNDISEEDAISEGMIEWLKHEKNHPSCNGKKTKFNNHKQAFQALWDSIYGTWSENPYVWAVEFKVMK